MVKKWWNEKVAYQIYPKSFYDTNGDGIGDLRGVIEKLDYLKDLGVDIIWLSPCYRSPLADQGYDISDYYDIDPRFGTMADMDELIAEAKKRDMYILMDLVVNHCSDEHEWFKKACEDPDGKYGNFFYLRDKKEGELPTNWRSYFGGPVWEDLPGTNKQYLHVFHKKQPDLNWENPEVREEVYKNINWWLDKGLGGFRIDAIINIKKALPMHDYEPDREDGLCSIRKMLKEAKGIGDFLGEMRDRTFKKYDAFSVGEVFDEKDEEIPDFIGDNGYFSSMFDFEETIWGASDKGWYDCKQITPDAYKKCCFTTQRKIGDIGFVSNIIENHDEPRGASTFLPDYAQNDDGVKMLATASLLLRGVPFIYQGQEIGMRNCAYASMDDYNDVSTHNQYNRALADGFSPEEALRLVQLESRDNARTPFQWDDTENAGFTTGKPWLKVNPNYTELNAAQEERDEDSVLTWYKKMIGLRLHSQWSELISEGTFAPAYREEKNLIAYRRRFEGKALLVLCNMQTEERELKVSAAYRQVLADNYKEAAFTGNTVRLRPYEVLIAEEA